MVRPPSHIPSNRALVANDHAIDHMNDAICLKDIGNCDEGRPTFSVFRHPVPAVAQHDPQFPGFECGELGCAVSLLDLLNKVGSAQSARG